MGLALGRTVPTVRIFSLEQARMQVIDRFNDRIIFGEPTEKAARQDARTS